MGWSRHDEEARADHYRAERKHDFPSIRHLEPKISRALELAILIKNLPNVTDGAKLIEDYVAERASEQRLEAVAAGARP